MCESVRQCSCCLKLLLKIKGSINAGNVAECRGFVENSYCAVEQYLLCAACSLKRQNFYFRAVANCLKLFRAGPSINTTRLPSFCKCPSKAVSKYSADVQVFLYFPPVVFCLLLVVCVFHLKMVRFFSEVFTQNIWLSANTIWKARDENKKIHFL